VKKTIKPDEKQKSKKGEKTITKKEEKTITKKVYIPGENTRKNLFIVESQGKVKTIEEFLGKDFKVIASFGHICQLSKTVDGVTIDEKGINFKWEEDSKKIEKILNNLHGIEKMYLATDMDREGEAIAWHLQELVRKNKFPGVICRIFFFEITKNAILESIKNPRDVDMNLVNAYLTRVGLDHRVGFAVSPVLWRKLPSFKGQSAGRVQSPALRLISERDFERNNFKKTLYYSMEANFNWQDNMFAGKLIEMDNFKISDHHEDREKLEDLEERLKTQKNFTILEIKKKNIKENPNPPFITSTLQQEANKFLNLKIAEIMKIAQELYEGVEIHGENKALITYMRTDSLNISKDAMKEIRSFIKEHYKRELSNEINTYKNKVKNAQEAHECIRPIYIHLTPDSIQSQLTPNQFRIYDLIWRRTVACQMISAKKEQISAIISSEICKFKTTTTIIRDPGFLTLFESVIPKKFLPMNEGDAVALLNAVVKNHETQPPFRFTEASLIQELEKYGIGRPSTYATIIEVLQVREYVAKQQKAFEVKFKGALICCFLKIYFSKYLDFDFTAQIESILDDIANGKVNYNDILIDFNRELEAYVAKVSVINNIEINDSLSPIIIHALNRKCECGGELHLRSKYMFFFVCRSCEKIQKIEEDEIIVDDEIKIVKTPKYQYIDKNGIKIFLPQNFKEELTQQDIETICTFPIEVGKFESLPIFAKMSKFGFYLEYNKQFYNLNFKNISSLSEESAIEIIKNSKKYKYQNYQNNKTSQA